MLTDIKKELLNNPEKLKNVLEYFGYCNIIIHRTYMSFGRGADSSPKSIVIKLENNNWLYVTDYARNINSDLFSYIIDQRNVKFVDVLTVVKSELGISDFYTHYDKPKGIFGGFYNNIKKRGKDIELKIYDESILDDYISIPNARFLKDNISIESQKEFGIRYDTLSQSIIIPIRDEYGQLIGVKARINREPNEDEQKYFYLYPGQINRTLYGYAHNYKYLSNNTIYILEAEKSVLQCWSYRFKNCVALGSGSLSKKQAQLLIELNPKKIIFLHDVGYEYKYIKRNIEMLKSVATFSEAEIGYWNWFDYEYDVKNKDSPSDFGENKFIDIITNEIKMIGDEDSEEEL